MDPFNVQDHDLKGDCTVQIDGDQVVVRLPKGLLKEKRKVTILLDVPQSSTSTTDPSLRMNVGAPVALSWDRDDDCSTSETEHSCTSSLSEVPLDDVRALLSQTFASLLGRSSPRLEPDRQSSHTSFILRPARRAKIIGSRNNLPRKHRTRNANFMGLPREIREKIYSFVATEFEPPQGGCVCRAAGKTWCEGGKNIDPEAIWRRAWDNRNTGSSTPTTKSAARSRDWISSSRQRASSSKIRSATMRAWTRSNSC
jgi:hypothetical protein